MSRKNTLPGTGLLAWRLQRALDYIDSHISRSITLVELADAAGFSRMHFARMFRLATGLRPSEYVARRRVERAKHLLVHTSSSVASIAQESGFGTHSYFTNVFRRFNGQPPAAWRRYRTGRQYTMPNYGTGIQASPSHVP
jgi:transcriptional regulator GlxA family with amidase domain